MEYNLHGKLLTDSMLIKKNCIIKLESKIIILDTVLAENSTWLEYIEEEGLRSKLITS